MKKEHSIRLELLNPEWVNGPADDPHDFCSHGRIDFQVNHLVITAPDEEWCTSAAGLFLLRSVFEHHDQNHSVTGDNYLIPCCGHGVFPDEEGPYDVMVTGCNLGIDPRIRHNQNQVWIDLDDNKTSIDLQLWVRAIVQFADQVEAFYQKCSPKKFFDDELMQSWWDLFWQEWHAKKTAAKALVKNN